MTKKLGIAALCAALAACGGSSGAGNNSASGKQFTYGDATAYTGTGASTVTSQLMAVVDGSATSPMALTSVNAATVLGPVDGVSMPSSFAADTRAAALRAAASPRAISGEFDNTTCLHETETDTSASATFTNCTITLNASNPEYKITVNGTAALNKTGQNSGELKWDLDVAAHYVGTDGTFDVTYGYNGDLTGSSSHIAGNVLSSLMFDMTSGGQTVKLGLDESLSLNLNLDEATCSSYVVGDSTLEAKRVWTAHPSSGTWVDKAVKISWSGCGVAQVQYSSNS